MKNIYQIADNYMSLGTHVPSESDIPVFSELLHDLQKLPAGHSKRLNHAADIIGSWLYFEFGMAYENIYPLQAVGYLKAAELKMPDDTQWPVHSASGTYIAAKNKILLGLYGSGLARQADSLEEKRAHGIRSLGRLLVSTTAECDHSHGQAYHDYRGTMAEIAIAGALLLPAFEDDQNTFRVAPASLRQDFPYTAIPYQDRITTKRSAIDLNVFDAKTNHYTPVQIKTREQMSDRSYREDILMLYAERDLFTITNQEYEQLGHDLANFDNTIDPPHLLFVAKSNIDLAYKINAGLPLYLDADSL